MIRKACVFALVLSMGAMFLLGCAEQEHGVASESGNIIVYEPAPNDVVSSPLFVSGVARVFEANVLLRIRDEKGAEIAFTFTTATVAGPEFGEFETELPYVLTQGEEQGTLEVFSVSAKTGEEEDMVRIPITLRP